MSRFRDSGIVLKIQKYKEKQLLLQLFSHDFGKISVLKSYSKREKNIDLGNEINYELYTKKEQGLHMIKNVTIRASFSLENTSFSILTRYMSVLAKVKNEFQEGVPNREVYLLLKTLTNLPQAKITDFLLAELKIQAIEGQLPSTHTDTRGEKLLRFIENNSFTTLLKLTGFDEKLIAILSVIAEKKYNDI